MDIEAILEMYEDDYNPSSTVPGPRNMYNQGQLVQPNDDGFRPGYSGQKKTIKGTGKDAGNITTYVGGRDNQIKYIGSQEYIDKIRQDNPKFGKTGPTVHQQRADKAAVNKKAIIKNFKDNLGIDVEVGKNNLITGKGLTEELKQKIANAQSQYRKKNPGQAGLTNEGFWEFYSNIDKNKKAAATAAAEKEAAKIKAKDPKNIAELNRPLTPQEKIILNKSYDNIFLEEFDRLKNEGDLFSKTDLNRAVINRIAEENPTIDLESGKGLDKVFNANEEHKSMHERTDGGKTSLISKEEKIKYFTKNTNALGYTKNQDRLLQALLSGNTDFDDLAEELGFNEGRLKGNLNKLMRNLAYTEKSKQPLFFKKYSQEDLEKARNAVFDSPTLESTYQRTALQSILASTVEGSKQRKDALNKYKEFNKFKAVMKENGIDPKLVAMDHAASYRAIKNGNVKNFLAMTPIMSDINAIKSTFDRRSQLNLRRMQDAITSGDNVSYKKFLKNQTELEGIWKTMTGDQSSLGKIRIGATGKKKGVTKIFDYGATSILDKNKDLLNELSDNLVIRENIVKASTKGNLDEVSRIMFEGSEAEKPRASKLPKSFKNLNKPEMFKVEKQIKKLLEELCPKGKASGGRIGFKSAGAVLGSGANCGRNHMGNLLKNGTGTTEERNLIKKVMKTGFDFAKGTGKVAVNLLDPKEFLKLKNWVGKPAMAAMAAVETADVADRWIRQGIPIKEALGEKWTKFLMPRSLQEYQVEGMKETNSLSSPASKRYAKGIELSNDLARAYDQLEMLEKGEAAKFRKTGDTERIAELKKSIKTKEKKYYDYLYQTDEKGNVLGDGELDFIKDYNEYRAKTKTGRDFTDLDIFGGMNDMGTDEMSGLKIKKDYFPMYKIGTDKIPSEQELAIDATLAKEPFVRERLVPLPQLKDFKYQNKELPAQNRIDAENFFTDKGLLPPRTSLSQIPLSGKGDTYDLLKDLTDDYNRIQKSKEARSKYPAYGGSQFSEGGITTLRSKYEYKK